MVFVREKKQKVRIKDKEKEKVYTRKIIKERKKV